MVEIKELQGGIEVVAGGYHEKFNSRFKAIMAAHALAFGESQAQGGQQVEIQVPAGLSHASRYSRLSGMMQRPWN